LFQKEEEKWLARKEKYQNPEEIRGELIG